MNIQLTQSHFDAVECDALIVPMFEDEKMTEDLPRALDEKLDGLLNELRPYKEWTAKFGRNNRAVSAEPTQKPLDWSWWVQGKGNSTILVPFANSLCSR